MSLVKFSLLKRRGDIDHEAFSRHWAGPHVEVLIAAGHRMYNLNYAQNHFFVLDEPRFGDDRFDGAAQMVQRSGDAIMIGFQDDPRYLRDVRPDERNFLNVDSATALFTRPVALHLTQRPRGVKLMTFFKYRPGAMQGEGRQRVPREELSEIWPLVSSHIEYYTVSGGGRPFTDGDRGAASPVFDGVSEITFEDLAAMKRALNDATFRLLAFDPDWDGASHHFLSKPLVVYDDSLAA